MLRGALREMSVKYGGEVPVEFAELRAETLTLDDFIRLAGALAPHTPHR